MVTLKTVDKTYQNVFVQFRKNPQKLKKFLGHLGINM